AFAAKLDGSDDGIPDGTLVWNTFMGAAGIDYGYAIAVDTDTPPYVYVAGTSTATWGTGTPPFPVNPHAGGANSEVFAAKIGLLEINIRQDTSNISDGGTYDFGSQNLDNDYDRTFTIENTGNANLTLTTSITITGTNADQFSVQQEPSSPVASGGSTTFDIRFSPTSTGLKEASISIANNDIDENPYDINFTGTGTSGLKDLTIAAGTGGTTIPHPGIYGHSNGTNVEITAIADSGYRFSNWTGNVPAPGTANPVTVTMDSDKSVTANFSEIATKFVIINPADSTAGTATTVTVQAQCTDSSVDTLYNDDVTLVADGSATGEGLVDISSGVGSLAINDDVAETVNLSLSDTQSTTLDVSSTQNVVFSPGTASYLKVTGTASMTAGSTNELTITAYDQYDNVATVYSGSKDLTFSGPSTALSGTVPTVE
ncbi:hypothetical protein LCGC14_2725770, partial [marine sediment metagenome]